MKILEQIKHEELTEALVPRPNAQWQKIKIFASSFNAYEQLGGFKPAASAGNIKARDIPSCSLTDLRAALFFEYRRHNHYGYDPDTESMSHIHELVEEIRKRVIAGEHKNVDT